MPPVNFEKNVQLCENGFIKSVFITTTTTAHKKVNCNAKKIKSSMNELMKLCAH